MRELFSDNQYEILNIGIEGGTVIKNKEKKEFKSYWDSKQFKRAKKLWPDAVVIMFGTNDARLDVWDQQ